MNRTLRVERWPVTGLGPGEILLATEITHPERGVVACPAVPLLAAALARGEPDPGGCRVRVGPAPAGPAGPDGAVLVMASYLDRAGRPAGFGAAAPADDRAAVAACTELVTGWAAVLRSRRLLVADGDPDCAGARTAIDAVLQVARDAPAGRPVYVFGRPVASAGRLAELQAAGVTVTGDLDTVPDQAIVAFPAHGAPLPVRAEAAARGLQVADATCPLAAAAHQDVRAYADRGDTVVLITGSRDTAARHVSVSQAPESVLPVRDAAEVPGLAAAAADPDRLSLVVQTGIPADEAVATSAVLRARFPRIRGQHHDALCYAAADRAATVRQVAAASDLTLILGAADDPDAAHMRDEAVPSCPAVRRIATPGDIAAGWLAGVTTVGLVPTRSAAPELVVQVRDALSGLGPLSVATRQVRTSPGLPARIPAAPMAMTRR